MDTHGHEEVAKAAGVPLLEEGFKARMGKPRLEAFYLGNWLTDISQVIDPKVGPKVKLKAHNFVDNAMGWLLGANWMRDITGFKQLGEWLQLKPALESIANEAKETVDGLVDWVMAPPPTPPGSPAEPTRLYKVAQGLLLLKGFFKFVHPDEEGKPPNMDLSAYIAVSEKHFTQYYPHEHLDRPEKSNSAGASADAETRYADDEARGPSTATAPQSPDLYRYLRDDIKYIAGVLTKLDLEWARKYLAQPLTGQLTDDDVEWNYGLARFGHAVHAIEDFFAHSNFIEHASVVMGGRFLPTTDQMYASRFLKRLKRYNYLVDPDDWRDADPEPHVVTGYFDFIDTLNSLGHILVDSTLGLFDLKSRDATEDWRWIRDFATLEPAALDLAEYKASVYYHDLMELFEDPKKLIAEDPNNLVRDAVRAFLLEIDNTLGESVVEKLIKFDAACKQGRVDQATMTKLVRHMPLFKGIVDQQEPAGPWKEADVAKLLRAFYDTTLLLRQTVTGISFAISYYKLLNSLTELVAAPTIWLKKKLMERIEKLPVEYATQVGIYLGKEIFLYSWGSMRLGCHSLLSKDHKVHEELRYEEMSGCAMLVHHTVVKTMMRWAQPNYESRPEDQKFVNWLVLLEEYLCHPGYGVACTTDQELLTHTVHIPTEAERRLRSETLVEQLVLRYRPVGMPAEADKVQRKVLEANVTSRRKRGKTEDSALQKLQQGMRLVLRATLPIPGLIMPSVPVRVPVCDPQPSPKWFMPVMTHGWKPQQAQHPANLVFHATEMAAGREAEWLDSKRLDLENSYR